MTNTRSEAIAANIKAEMARKGVTQAALGKRLNKSQAAMSARLRGHTAIGVNELLVIADHLGVDAVTLLTEPEAAAS